jgi:hypothetical protein
MINCLKNCDFGLKIEDNLTYYLSCKIQINQATKTTYVMQPHLNLIKCLSDKFGEEVEDLCNYGTPGTPRFLIVRPDDADKVDAAMQSKYRSRVGMLLHLIKYLRPDLANMERELSKCMDGASLAAYKEMQRVIKFVLDTRMQCLKIQPRHESEKWDLVLYCDSDWAGDPESRISVTGFIMHLLGVTIC